MDTAENLFEAWWLPRLGWSTGRWWPGSREARASPQCLLFKLHMQGHLVELHWCYCRYSVIYIRVCFHATLFILLTYALKLHCCVYIISQAREKSHLGLVCHSKPCALWMFMRSVGTIAHMPRLQLMVWGGLSLSLSPWVHLPRPLPPLIQQEKGQTHCSLSESKFSSLQGQVKSNLPFTLMNDIPTLHSNTKCLHTPQHNPQPHCQPDREWLSETQWGVAGASTVGA